jgi:hypothetical protein
MSYESQRNDTELLAAIDIEIAELIDILNTAQHKLLTAYDLLNEAHELQEGELDMVSPLFQAKMHVINAIEEVRKHTLLEGPSNEWIQAVAGNMSHTAAEDLKEKHHG